MNEMSKLTKEQEMELGAKIAQGDKKALNTLVEHNIPFVRYIAKNACRRNKYLNFDDVVQSGCLGLIIAAQRFDFTLGVPFVGYAKSYILNEMQLNRTESNWMDVSERDSRLLKKINKINESTLNSRGRYATPEEVSLKLGIKFSKAMDLMPYASTPVYLDAPVAGDEENVCTGATVACDSYYEPEEQYLHNEEMEELNDSIESLSDKEQKVITLLFDLEHTGTKQTLRSVGDKLGLSPEGVNVVKRRALNKLRTRMAA